MPKKILIVEDEKAMVEALANKFKKEGFAVIEAHDGEEGYELAVKEKPDLIMLDIIMPKLDGMGLLKKIRETDKWGMAVPIIMLTNLNDPDQVSEAANYRVYDFLVKTDWRLDDVVRLARQKVGD
jgi:DNA-binding response OmpR family regulator